MLLGRGPEALRIERLVGAARRGESASLLIVGEPGIGKSALCDHAVDCALDMTVLRARGLESETELPFADLSSLLVPAIGHLADLPKPQGEALAGALGLGPPAAGDPLTVYAATLSLLAAAAEAGPLLAVIDDAHWLDGSSARALAFVARRLHAEGIVLLFAAPLEGGGRLGADVPCVVLPGLDLEASAELVARVNDGPAAPSVVERLHVTTGGNPLSLMETCASLTLEQLAGTEPLGDPLPVGPTLQETLRRRTMQLPAVTQRALLIAAASDSGAMQPIAGAMRTLELECDALEPAETAGLVRIEAGDLEFRHPLLRSAVYHGAAAPMRRAAHAALARALSGQRNAGRRAWHFAHAAVTPSEEVASALEQTAMEARRRSGSEAAARAFERSARLSPADEQRARRLFEAAVDYDLAGWPRRAVAQLDEALGYTEDQLVRADIYILRGRIESWRQPTEETQRLLLEQATRVEAADPGRAALLLINATTPSFLLGDTAGALAIAERAYAVGQRAGGPLPMLAALPLACALILRGDAERGRELVDECRPLVDNSEVFLAAPLAGQLMQCFAWLEDYEAASTIGQRVVEAARAASAPGVLRLVLAFRSELDFRLARWSEAYAHANEAVELAREAGSGAELAYSLTCLARIEAAQGREERCRSHVQEAFGAFGERAVGSTLSYGPAALGLLELGLGRVEQAIEQLEIVAAFDGEHGVAHPNVVPWRPDLVEAYARAGRMPEAEAALRPLVAEAERTGSLWARAAAWRCHGLLATDGFEELFERALEHQVGPHNTFDRARTELCLGERLRRSQRRVEARTVLRRALVAFERVGASPWAERAHAELRATGETARPRDPSLVLQLTPQELQVALTVSGGATNREAAAALFLSPKTVEFHLGRIYRKLNVRSRTELTRLVAAQELEGAEADLTAAAPQ